MPTFRKFKVKWGKSHISTHATRRPACPPRSVCGGQSGWPGSAVDRGSAGEPSGAHSLWQAAEICPTRSVCSLSRHVRVSASQAARSGCVSRGTSWLAQKTLLGTEPVLVPLWGRVKLVGPQKKPGPCSPCGDGPPTTQTLALDFTWTELTSSVN